MRRSRRIFVIADFKDDEPKSIHVQARMWVKGLLRLGHDVQRFSYRNVLVQCNPFCRRHARHIPSFVRKRTDRILTEQVKAYNPDVIFIFAMKYLTADTVHRIKEIAPEATIVGRDEDPYPEKNPARLAIAKNVDIMTSTNAGRFLKIYKDMGIPLCAFIPNTCDPDIQYRYPLEEKWKTDIVFTGKVKHKKLEGKNDLFRYEIVNGLGSMPNARVYGDFGIPRVEGLDYFHAISGAKISLSINIANNVRLYHSDRLINYLSCGTFVLAKRVPNSDLLFEDGVHLRYFDSVEEFFELADWYLKHDQEREKIAAAGMERAHREFNCEKIAECLLDLVENGTYETPWACIL